MNNKEAIEFLEELITSNPYPEDIFLPILKKDFIKSNDLLKKEMGHSLDRLSGNMGRELYKSLKNNKKLREVIGLLQRGEKFEAMWYELNDVYFHSVGGLMKLVKQKYFLKPIPIPKSVLYETFEAFETDGVDDIPEEDLQFHYIDGKWKIIETYNGKPISEIKAGGTD